MEQKAKRIGKLNIIDLIAIVLIVAVLALAAWKFIGKNGDSINYERPQTKVTYQVKVEGVAPELYENCQAHLPSPLMASGALVGGQIEAVEKRDLSGAGRQWELGHGPGPCDVDLHRDHHHPYRRGHDHQGGRSGGPHRQDRLYPQERVYRIF